MSLTTLTQLEKELKAAFGMEYEATDDPISSFVTSVSSEANEEIYAMLSTFPEINEWLDDRQIQSLKDFPWTIKNRHFEGTIGVNKDDLADGATAGTLLAARQLGQEAAEKGIDLVTELIDENGLCFDGQNFFDTDHKLGTETAWANTHTGTGVTAALLTADYKTTLAKIMALKNPKGNMFFKRRPKIAVLSPAALYPTFEDLLTLQLISGSTNALYGKFELVYLPLLDDANDWYMGITNKTIKGIILQNRQAPKWDRTAQGAGSANPGDIEFMKNLYIFGVDMRLNAGYGWPHFLHRVTNA